MPYADHKDPVKLVATTLPPGKQLLERAGQSSDRMRLLSYVHSLTNVPAGAEIVTAESVGLEWHEDGVKDPHGDNYRIGRYCVLVPADNAQT